jgi:calcineurin-like phosphoesterase family protein
MLKNNSNIFIASDTWFNRPMGDYSHMTIEEYNNMVIDNWNVAVGNDDIVYVLGGFGIGDCYDIVLKLNGKIHFLNSVYGQYDEYFRDCIKEGVENCVNKDIQKRIFFERNQIIVLPNEDCILSYFPLNNWAGKSTGTFCFHGYTNGHNLKDNNVSCKLELWKYKPVSIDEIKNVFFKFEKILSK